MLKKIKTAIALAIDTAAALIMAALVLIVLWQVMSRYLMRTPSPWTEELAGFLMIWAAMVGATAALRRKAHLGIDVFTTHLTGGRKMWVQIAASVCSGLFCLLVLGLGGSELVWKTLLTSQISPVMTLCVRISETVLSE